MIWITNHEGKNISIFKGPKVLEVAKKHFSCEDVKGIPLENEGGDGTANSHWDRVTLGDEMMSGSSINQPKYSVFTMALLEDTGWYEPVYSYADDFIWGLGEGCGFINNGCHGDKKYRDFCEVAEKTRCTANGEFQ